MSSEVGRMDKTRSPNEGGPVQRTTITIEEVGDDHHDGRSGDRVEHLLETLIGRIDKLMADVAALETAIAAVETAEVAGVEELKALTDQIAALQAGEITQDTIDSLTARATAAATALAAGTEAAKGTEAPPAEPPAEPTPAEPPVGEAPPAAAE